MLVNNNTSPLPFYDNIALQNHRKDYAFGSISPIIIKDGYLLPFQCILHSDDTLSIVEVYLNEKSDNKYTSIDITDSIINNGLAIKEVSGYKILKYFGNEPIPEIDHEGLYYLIIVVQNLGPIYSEIFVNTSNVSDCILLEYSHDENLYFDNGVIDFSDDFKFQCYLKTQIGKPEYDFEEEATNRMGYNFIESQVSKKIYKFTIVAPEYLCDALRIVRLCANKTIIDKYAQTYSLITFSMEPEWQDQGDLASVECEFETDTVIVNIGGYSHSQSSSETSSDEESTESSLYLNVRQFGAAGDGITDDTDILQAAIDEAYYNKARIYMPRGTYLVTKSLFVYDGIEIKGDGIYNTIIKTPFSKSDTAKEYVDRDKNKRYNTISNPEDVPTFDYANGHNRFYIGDGVVGYYDYDRDTNPDHPLYWPNDNSDEWEKWYSDRQKIISTGRWVGKTGREGYGNGVIKSSQKPGLFYEDYTYSHVNPKGIIHTGIRNIKFSDFQINTNSSDRGKDSAIDFQYKASNIPSAIRDTYDSSVLNVQLYNLYLFSLGKSGYRATRAVDHTIIGCYARQCAEQGFYLDGVTSIFFTGCYANSCLEGGYVLKGCNYSSLNSCAADSCSIGYNLYNCNGISLNGCGAEATRYQKAEETEEEDPYKGRAFAIRSCTGISLTSCYAMTSHPKYYGDDAIDANNDEIDENWLRSRHVMVMSSKDVNIAYCYFKCFQRVRSTPYRDADNNKVNYQGGTYDPTIEGSRYWQIQSYLVGAMFEVRDEDSSVHIVSGQTKENIRKESEIRTNNLDILDPGTVTNPLASEGYSTAGKTLKGYDGNGGWTYTDDETGEVKPVTMENFEFLFPINAKKNYGVRDKFWAWRNSLILVRINSDTSLDDTHPDNYYGYIDILGEDIDWSDVSDEDMSKFTIDIVNDYTDTSFIDGDEKLFSYGDFAWHQLDKPVAYEPAVFSPIPCLVRDKPEGCRIAINTNDISGFPAEVNKASVSIVGNQRVEATDTQEAIDPGMVLALLSRRVNSDLEDDTKFMTCLNDKGTEFFSIFEKGEKSISIRNRQLISSSASDYDNIPELEKTANLADVISRLNDVINRLIAHGLSLEAVVYNFVYTPSIVSFDIEQGAQLLCDISNPDNNPIYRVGVAYSSTKASPSYDDNAVIGEAYDSSSYIMPFITLGTTYKRYIRFFIETTETPSANNRAYSSAYALYHEGGNCYITQDLSVEGEPYEQTASFSDITVESNTETAAVLNFDVVGVNVDIYTVGIAYSSSNTEPTTNNNSVVASNVSGDTYEVSLPITEGKTRYVRMYAETSSEGGASNRIYSSTYVLTMSSGDISVSVL